jgi:hypothetical protein
MFKRPKVGDRVEAGTLVHRVNPSGHECGKPGDGFLFSRWDDGDQWRCDHCGRVWTRFENWAGGGWD